MYNEVPDPWEVQPPSRDRPLQRRLGAHRVAQDRIDPPPPWWQRSWRDEVDDTTGRVIAYGLCANWILCIFDGLSVGLLRGIGEQIGGMIDV